MEPRDRAPEALSDGARDPEDPRPADTAVEGGAGRLPGFRLLAGCVLLVGLAFIQDPGFLTSDTKFDLVADPGGFLVRALHLWDGQGAFGQLQNQAYGYLWPMGPFFWLGALAAVPGWVVQRLWLGLVLSVAFAGTAKLTRALGIRSDLACLLAGLAFALSPRMLTALGPISIEAWPSALAPWVLLALVHGSRSGSPRRWAGLAALGVAMVGGVNAAATFAVLPLGVVWLLTRTPGPRRRSLMVWWPLLTLLGTLWWLVPLFVMGAYSPPFLSYIETTSVTTFPTTLFDALRGTSNWVPYVDPSARAGRDLISTGYLALDSGVVLLLGFAGLLSRHNPHRRFLGLSLLVGVLMVTAGHEGSVQGWFAAPLRDLLDGSLSPLRNVHKFDPIIRLPLVLGLAFAVERVRTEVADHRDRAAQRGERLPVLVAANQAVFVGMAALAVLGAAVPALVGRIAPSAPTLEVPGYWSQTARWLAEHSGQDTSLLAPGSAFAAYLWGSPRDEPMQFLAGSRWATRNVIPLAPPGNIRMLDGVEERLAQGSGSRGLAPYLRRAGVRYLVVRNDLRRASDVPDPVLVHQAIAGSPGLRLAAHFGPSVGGGAHLVSDSGRIVVNGGWQARYPAVQVYEVAGPVTPAVGSGPPPVVAGGPEDLLDLLGLGVIGDAPVELAADASTADAERRPPGGVVLTDGLRAREHFFARIHDGQSAALTPGDRPRSGNPMRDYLIDHGDRWSTTVRLDGATRLSASSSMSDSTAPGGTRRGTLPYAAVDGDRATSWLSGLGKSKRAWWSIGLEAAVSPSSVTVTGGVADLGMQEVRIRTSNGTTASVRVYPGESHEIRLPRGRAISWLRVEEGSRVPGRPLSLAEVEIPGVRVERSLVLPVLPTAWGDPDSVVLRADRDARTGCARVSGDVRCVEGADRVSEEPLVTRRVLTLAEPAAFRPRLRVVPRPGAALDDFIFRDQPARAAASSTAVPDERGRAIAAIDGDPGTTWTATGDDLRRSLSLSWLGMHRITAIALATNPDSAARQPTRVSLVWAGGRRTVRLDRHGHARFRPFRAHEVRVVVRASAPAVGLDFSARRSELGVGISEVRLAGLPFLPLRLSAEPRRLPCGSGPDVVVGGQTFPTAVRASARRLAQGRSVAARPCGRGWRVSAPTLRFAAGENDVALTSSAAFSPHSLVLRRPGAAPADAAVTPSGTGAANPVTRVIRPVAGDAVVAMRENANAGWAATQDGRGLRPLVLDGWQQGWVLRDAAPVRVVFAPDRAYRLGLGAGLGALLVLVALVVVDWRRRPTAVPAATGTRRVPAPLVVGAGLAGVGLVAGWPGVAFGTAVGLLARGLARRRPEELPWVLAAPVLVAAVAYLALPWGSSSGWAGNDAWPHYLALVPFVGVLVPAEGERWRLRARGRRPFSRNAGRSTSR